MIIAVTAALISVSVGLAAAAPLQLGLSSNVKSDLLLVNRNNNGVTAGQGGVGGLSGRVDKPDVPAGTISLSSMSLPCRLTLYVSQVKLSTCSIGSDSSRCLCASCPATTPALG